MAETLADILLEQIISPVVAEHPEPVLTPTQRIAAASIYLSAMELCRQLSSVSHLDEATLWAEILKLPDDWLWKLNYPDGWTVLGDYLATSCGGVMISPYTPTIH